MRPLQRLNFVLRQEAPRFDEHDGDVGFDEVDYPGEGAGASEIATFKPAPVAKQAHPLATRRGGGKRRWLVTGEPRDEPAEPSRERRDAEIAERLVHLVRELNQNMEAASKQGLIVEPVLSQVNGRYGGADEAGRHILSLKLFRKLC